MGRIKNGNLYIIDEVVSKFDRVIGSDNESAGRTKNYTLGSLFNLFSKLGGLGIFSYSYTPNLNNLDTQAGVFSTNDSQTNPDLVTSIRFSREDLYGNDLTTLIENYENNSDSVILKIASEVDPNLISAFKITGINTDTNWVEVSVLKHQNLNTLTFENLENFSLSFDLVNTEGVGTGGDHTLLTNIGTNTHEQIDSHIADTNTHFTQAEISITESQISDLSHFEPSTLLNDYSFTDNSTNWDTAFGWGDHSLAGYLTSETDSQTLAWVDGTKTLSISGGNSQVITGFADSVHTHTIADITDFTDNSTNWDTAFGWGDHSVAGYLSPGDINTFLELDTIVADKSLVNFEDGGAFLSNISAPAVTDLDYIAFDTAATPIASTPGLLQWNDDEQTLDLSSGGVTYQIGQEVAPLVKNQTGSTIPNGRPVMFGGTVGASGRVLVIPAYGDGTLPSSYILGLTTEDIADGADGHVTWFGKVRQIDTTGTPFGEVWSDGDLLYVSPTTAGHLTNVPPEAPNPQIFMGVVLLAHANNGTIFTRASWRGKLTDLDDVNGTPLTTTGQIAVWNQANKYFDFTSNISDFALSSHTHVVSDIQDLGDNYMDLTTDQTISGIKTFDGNIIADTAVTLPSPWYEEDFSTSLGDFTTSGDLNWTRVTDEGNGDSFSARSGAITNDEISILTLSKTTTQKSTLVSFDYKTSTEENFDWLMVVLDGQLVDRFSGTNGWTTRQFYIDGIGTHEIKFIYFRDHADDGGTNQVWVDNVRLYNYDIDIDSYGSLNVTDDLYVSGNTMVKNKLTVGSEIITNGEFHLFNPETEIRAARIRSRASANAFTLYNQVGWQAAAVYSTDTVNGFEVYSAGTNDVQKMRLGSFDDVAMIELRGSDAKAFIGEVYNAGSTKSLTVNGEGLFRGDTTIVGYAEATGYKTPGGLSTQFLKADGTLDSNTYLTSFDITTQTDPKYLRSDVADIKTSGNLTFNDNAALVLGTGGDALLYQNGSENRLQLNANDFAIRDGGALRFTFERTTGNFTATGAVTSDGLTVLGSGSTLPTAFWSEDFSSDLGDFTTSGSALWTRVTDEGNGDLFSAVSGNISDKQVSVLEVTKTTTQYSTALKYDYKTSTEGDFDFFLVMVDDVIRKRYSGTNTWTTDQIYIHGIGSHTIKFVYWKDNSADGGTDQVWVDNVGLYNASEDVVIDVPTVFKGDLNVVGNITAEATLNTNEINAKRRINVHGEDGLRTIALRSGLSSGDITLWNNTAQSGAGMYVSNAYNEIQLSNGSTGAKVLSAIVNTITSPNGLLQMEQPGAKVSIGNTNTTYNLDVTGDARFTSDVTANSFITNGGTASQFVKGDGTLDSSTYLTSADLPSLGTSTQVPFMNATNDDFSYNNALVFDDSTDTLTTNLFVTDDFSKTHKSVKTITSTTYTLVLEDRFGIISMDNTLTNSITIPDNSSVAFPVGTEIVVVNRNIGVTTLTIVTDVVNTLLGSLTIPQFGKRTLIKIAPTEWIVGN